MYGRSGVQKRKGGIEEIEERKSSYTHNVDASETQEAAGAHSAGFLNNCDVTIEIGRDSFTEYIWAR